MCGVWPVCPRGKGLQKVGDRNKNQAFSRMLAQYKVSKPDMVGVRRAEMELGTGAIAYQLSDRGAHKLYQALSQQAEKPREER